MPLSLSFLNSIGAVSFSNAAGIDNYFIKTVGQDFISWFNAHVADRGNWGQVNGHHALSIATDSYAHNRFNQLWSNESIQAMLGTGKISLLQFLALQCIIINETGGKLVPLTEAVGSSGHPGIAYAFDRIPGLKKSYNTLPENKTCLQNFNDVNYNHAFGTLPLADKLKNTDDHVWAGEVFPQLRMPTSTNTALSGYILEADFFKFRGRGFIQTTGRTNYSKLIQFITGYTGSESLLSGMKAKWNGISKDTDVLASISSNADWDNLFQNSNCLVAGRAICVHNESCGNYILGLNGTNQDVLNTSLYNMGLRVSGAGSYAALFQNRVVQVLEMI